MNFDNYTKNVKKEGEGSKYVGEHQPHQERQKLLRVREGPKICRRKLNFDNYTKNVKKEGEGSKYVGDDWPCDNG